MRDGKKLTADQDAPAIGNMDSGAAGEPGGFSRMTVKKAVLMALGFAALGLGGVGLCIPLLPTTPFVICAAACFSIANPSLYRKLEKSRYFGEYIRNYREKTGISRRARVGGLAFLWITLAISAIVFPRPLVWIILGVVGAAVSVHILLLRASPKS